MSVMLLSISILFYFKGPLHRWLMGQGAIIVSTAATGRKRADGLPANFHSRLSHVNRAYARDDSTTRPKEGGWVLWNSVRSAVDSSICG